MEVILIERHKKLGEIGTIINVKNGYARNYLIPTNKAIIANEKNKKAFELRKSEIEQEFDQKKKDAEKIIKDIEGKNIIFVEQAAEDERLYGSVNSNHIVGAIKQQLGHELHKSSVQLIQQIKYLGVYEVTINIFSDLSAQLQIIIARTQAEADEVIKKMKEVRSGKKEQQKQDQDKHEEKSQTAESSSVAEEKAKKDISAKKKVASDKNKDSSSKESKSKSE